MKLATLCEALKDDKTDTKGTYVAVKFSADTKKRIKAFVKKFDIPEPLSTDNLHTTLIYSRKHLPDFKAQGKLDPAWTGTVKKLDIFKSKEDNNCLVVLFNSEDCNERHKQIMKVFEATYDHPTYKTHFTLSYNCGDFDIDSIKNVAEEIGEIEMVEEYTEDLNLDWAKKA